MLSATRYNPGKYPPGPRFPQFGDGAAVEEVEEARRKLAAKRQVMGPFHLDRLQQDRLVPVHSVTHILRPEGHEIEMQTENPTDDRGVQTDDLFRRRNTQRDDEGDEHDTGGGRGSRGNLASQMAASASTGARHIRPIANAVGVVGGGIALAGGYVAGAITSMGFNGLKSAGGVVMNALTGPTDYSEDAAEDAIPTPAPLAVGVGRSAPVGDAMLRPPQPVPAFLLDREERMNAARLDNPLGHTDSEARDLDRRRLDRDLVRNGPLPRFTAVKPTRGTHSDNISIL